MSKGPHKYSYEMTTKPSEHGFQRFVGQWSCSCGHTGHWMQLGIDRFGAERKLRTAHRIHTKGRNQKSVA
jgi:hypothetical protein